MFDQSKPALLTKYQEVYRARSLDLWKKEKYYDKYVELDCLSILLRRQFDACVCRADAEKERLKINSWFSLPHEKEMGGENGARFVLFFAWAVPILIGIDFHRQRRRKIFWRQNVKSIHNTKGTSQRVLYTHTHIRTYKRQDEDERKQWIWQI